MKYYTVEPSKDASSRLTNLSYLLYKQGIQTEICLDKNQEGFPNFNFEFSPLFIGEPPYTDLLEDGSMGYGITISEKTYNAFELLNLGKHKFYKIGSAFDDDTKIELGKIYYRLEIIKISSEYLNSIDFTNSNWASKQFFADIEIELKIESIEQYHQLNLTHNNNIYFKKILFNRSFKKDFPDLFKLHELKTGLYSANVLICSENFKQVVENNQLTGFEFNEIEIEFEDEIL